MSDDADRVELPSGYYVVWPAPLTFGNDAIDGIGPFSSKEQAADAESGLEYPGQVVFLDAQGPTRTRDGLDAALPSDHEEQSEGTPPAVQSAIDALVKHLRKLQRRKARRTFLAYLVIVAYGGFLANVDVGPAKHPTLLSWFWTAVLGFLAYAFVAGLLDADVSYPGDEPE